MRECDAVGSVKGFQVNLVEADARLDGNDSSQQLTMLTRIKTRHRQYVPAFLRLPVDGCQMAYLPDKVIVGFNAEPQLQYSADAEPLILTSEEAPRALQHPPELHEAILGILNLNHSSKSILTK